MRYQGRITRWNDDRGFGFITPHGSRNLVFVHLSAFADQPQGPVLNAMVDYELSDDKIGRPKAENVTLACDAEDDAFGAKRILFALAGLVLLLVVLSAAGFVYWKGWPPLPDWLRQMIPFN